MKPTPQFTAAREGLVQRALGGVTTWKVSAEVVSQVSAETGLAREAVLAAAWHDAPEKEFKRVSLPVVFVAGGKTGESGVLTLDFLECAQPQSSTGFLAAWEMQAVPKINGFAESFAAARNMINELDRGNPLWPDKALWLVRWNLPASTPLSLDGESLGGAIALGLLALLNLAGKIPADHKYAHKLRLLTQDQIQRGTITAKISPSGNLESIEGLEKKAKAAKGTALFTGGTRPQILSASSKTTNPIHVTDLMELLGFLRELEKKSILPNKRSSKIFWTAAASILLIATASLCSFYLDHLWHPNLEQLSERIAGYARVSRADNASYENKNLDLSERAFLVEIEDINEEEWIHVIQPILAQVRERIALRIKGGSEEYVGQPFGLHNLAGIRHLSCLELIRAPVSDISGARRLPMLERLVIVGSPVKNLEWIGKLETLKQLCLDSGHIERMPLALNLPLLREAYLHFPDRSWDVNPKGISIDEDSRDDAAFADANSKVIAIKGANIQRLWIGGDKIEELRLIGLDSLKELSILAPSLNPSGYDLGYNEQCLEKLDLRCERLTEILLGRHTALKRLKLMSPKLKKIGNLPASLCTLDLSSCPLDAAHLGVLQSLGELRHLFLEGTHIKELPDLRELHKLKWLNLEKTEFEKWPKLSSEAGGCFLQVEHTPIGTKHHEAFKKAEAFVAEWMPGKHEPSDKWLHFSTEGVFDTEFETAMFDGGDYMIGADSDAHIQCGKDSYFDQHPQCLSKFDGNRSWWYTTGGISTVGEEGRFELRGENDSDEEAEVKINKGGTHSFNGWKGGFVGPQTSGKYWLDREAKTAAEGYDIYDLDAW